MAEIRITATRNANGPEVPSDLGAIIGYRDWGDGPVAILRLFLGPDEVQVWPADKAQILALAKALEKVANRVI